MEEGARQENIDRYFSGDGKKFREVGLHGLGQLAWQDFWLLVLKREIKYLQHSSNADFEAILLGSGGGRGFGLIWVSANSEHSGEKESASIEFFFGD